MKMLRQIVNHHMYINLIFLNSTQTSTFLKFMEAFKVLTIISASMFILVVLYDVMYPTDDGRCKQFVAEETCLSDILFRSRTYCVWDSGTCMYNEPDFDILLLVFLAWIELIILALISALVHYAFEYIILAPTASTVREQLKENQGSKLIRRMAQVSQGLRRLSVSIGNQARRLSTVLTNQVHDNDGIIQRVHDDIVQRAEAVKSTLLVDDIFVDKRRVAFELFNNYQYHHRHERNIIQFEGGTNLDSGSTITINTLLS